MDELNNSLRARGERKPAGWRLATLVSLAALGAIAGTWALNGLAGMLRPTHVTAEWAGPLRNANNEADGFFGPQNTGEFDGWWWHEPRADASPRWVDISGVGLSFSRLNVQLRDIPPEGSDEVLAVGVTIDEDGDGTADWVLGMDNQAPPGEHRFWLSDVGSGETTEQIGPPYGIPFDSWYPGEDGTLSDDAGPRAIFTPDIIRGMDRDVVQLFAWASITDSNDGVIAWDYAPDSYWISARRD